jgi:hypothetical protein
MGRAENACYYREEGGIPQCFGTFFWAFEFQNWDDFLLFIIAHARGG